MGVYIPFAGEHDASDPSRTRRRYRLLEHAHLRDAFVCVCVCVCVSVILNLTSRVFVRHTKDAIYLTGNEGQKICGVSSENAPLQS